MRLHVIGFTKWIFVTALAACILLYYTASSRIKFQDLVQLLTLNSSHTTSSNQAAFSSAASLLTGTCPEVEFPSNLVGLETKWQPIGTGNTMFAFSAYYVEEMSTVYIIGIKSRRDTDVICQLWWLEGDVFVMVEESQATTPRWLDDSGHRYSPTIFECFVTSPGTPYYVSLAIRGCESSMNLLKVENATPPDKYEREFTICPDPISLENTEGHDLVVWFESNRLMGADRFTLYVVSTTPETRAIIAYYANKGLVEVVDWSLPVATEERPEDAQPKEIADYARVAALNECLFRNKRNSEFVLNIDINEFVFTRDNSIKSWSDLIEHLDPSASSYCLIQGIFMNTNPGQTSSIACREYSKHFLRTAAATFTLPNQAPGLKVQRVPTRLGVMHRQKKCDRRKRSTANALDGPLLEEFQLRNILIKNVQYVMNALRFVPAIE